MIICPSGNRKVRSRNPFQAYYHWTNHCRRLSRYLRVHCGWSHFPRIHGHTALPASAYPPDTHFGYALGYADDILSHPPQPAFATPGIIRRWSGEKGLRTTNWVTLKETWRPCIQDNLKCAR